MWGNMCTTKGSFGGIALGWKSCSDEEWTSPQTLGSKVIIDNRCMIFICQYYASLKRRPLPSKDHSWEEIRSEQVCWRSSKSCIFLTHMQLLDLSNGHSACQPEQTCGPGSALQRGSPPYMLLRKRLNFQPISIAYAIKMLVGSELNGGNYWLYGVVKRTMCASRLLGKGFLLNLNGDHLSSQEYCVGEPRNLNTQTPLLQLQARKSIKRTSYFSALFRYWKSLREVYSVLF